MEPQELKEFLLWEAEHPEAILGGGLLYSESKGIVYGRYKSFKSIMAMYTAFCIADGKSWLGFETPKDGASVLYLQLEIPHPLLQKRVRKMWRGWSGQDQHRDTLKPIFYWTEPFLKLDRTDGQGKLDYHLESLKPDVLIIDPVYKIISGNILDPNQVRYLLDMIDQLIGKYHIAVVLISHPRKSAFDEETEWGSDDLLGSVLFSAWADTVIKMQKRGVKGGSEVIQVNFDIVRHAEDIIDPKEVVFDRANLMFSVPNILVQV